MEPDAQASTQNEIKMKAKHLLTAVLAACSTFGLQSCLKEWGNDNNIYIIDPVDAPNALVTVKNDAESGSFYLQLDDITTCKPVNLCKNPFGDSEVRAFAKIYEARGEDPAPYSKAVNVQWINSILTKDMAKNLGSEQDNAKEYGTDPVEIVNSWETVCEDGYLTLRFRTRWQGLKAHTVNLVYFEGEDGKVHAKFYHDAAGELSGSVQDGFVAFRLTDFPQTTAYTPFVLEWESFSGPKSVEFKYNTHPGLYTEDE